MPAILKYCGFNKTPTSNCNFKTLSNLIQSRRSKTRDISKTASTKQNTNYEHTPSVWELSLLCGCVRAPELDAKLSKFSQISAPTPLPPGSITGVERASASLASLPHGIPDNTWFQCFPWRVLWRGLRPRKGFYRVPVYFISVCIKQTSYFN